MVLSEGLSVPAPANGRRVEAFDRVTQAQPDDLHDPWRERRRAPEMAWDGGSEILGAADEPLRPEPFGRRNDASRRPRDARGLRTAGSPGTGTGGAHPDSPGDPPDVDDLLSTVRAYAESLTVQARADADELLSRAHAEAELLRARAEAVRAEAECLRAEAAALRIAVRDDAEATSERAESVARTHAAAEELRAAMQREADAMRDEFERMRAEGMAIRGLLRAEAEAGVVARERSVEVQRARAEADKLAAVLRLLSPGDEATGRPDEPGIDSADEWSVSAPDHGEIPLDRDGAALLREIWQVVSAESTRGPRSAHSPVPSPGSEDAPAPGAGPSVGAPWPAVESSEPPDHIAPMGGPKRASQPLIGSGGWQQKQAPSAPAVPDDAPPLAPAASRRRRRLRRE